MHALRDAALLHVNAHTPGRDGDVEEGRNRREGGCVCGGGRVCGGVGFTRVCVLDWAL